VCVAQPATDDDAYRVVCRSISPTIRLLLSRVLRLFTVDRRLVRVDPENSMTRLVATSFHGRDLTADAPWIQQ
jgi:hypothetical protein